MSIAEFIKKSVLRPRITRYGCLVVYDADRRYQDVCRSLASEQIQVVDTSESSIESREAALQALRNLAQPGSDVEGLLIYVPTPAPATDGQKQSDPFSLFSQCGAVFPQDDGDDYVSLCLRAKPDFQTEVRRVFSQNADPPFSVIDAIGGGVNWPHLRATLEVESAREILTALLAPSEAQSNALKVSDGWVREARDFLKATLGMAVKTRAKTWNALADEVWRFVLFSEFVFDLPVSLPPSLAGVPRAPIEAKPIVEDVCDRLRRDPRAQARYVERAETAEAELNLPTLCADITDLGVRDTFPFEERAFLHAAVQAIVANDLDTARQVSDRHKHSIWLAKGESQAQWDLIRSALSLVSACDDLERQLPDFSANQGALLDFYVGSLREADRLQREFEQAFSDFLDPHGLLRGIVEQARDRYRRLAERCQSVFMRHVETSGWPPAARLANADVFERFVGERLKARGRKVAFLLVDALRYELGVALEKLLSDDGPVELHAAYAQLPTVTPVGMASLLPGARNELAFALDGDTLVPRLAGTPVTNVTQRMDVLRRRYGDRFSEMTLADFVRGHPKLHDTVELLVLRSTEIDSQLESNPESTLRLIPDTLKMIRVAVHKLRGQGFHDAVIASDHGFFLNAQAGAGDVCSKPTGNWPVNAHDRMMLGVGNADLHNLVVSADKLGIRGDFSSVALPKSMAPYRAGHLYFHGGVSLTEAVVPVLVAKLDAGGQPAIHRVQVDLNYKGGAKKITTRIPVIEIVLRSDDIFSQAANVEVLLEAQDSRGNVVGEPRPGGDVNPATRTITLNPGQSKQIALRMEPDFEGKFTVKALNPTTLVAYQELKLETDYV